MRVAISKKHINLNDRLSKESNSLAQNFNAKAYSKIESADSLLPKRSITVEKKKQLLLEHLHKSILKTFSIDKKKFSKKAFGALKKRIHSIRIIINKLRSINYYLETSFIEDLKTSKIKMPIDGSKAQQFGNLSKDELDLLEYAAYRTIGKAIMLDKRLVKEYLSKKNKIIFVEKTEARSLKALLNKETLVLEHLEAKMPPPALITGNLLKDPIFTHWVARVFALLSYLEHLYCIEKEIFKKIRKNRAAKSVISRKISELVKEKSKLLNVLEAKEISMKRFYADSKIKKQMHNLSAIINL